MILTEFLIQIKWQLQICNSKDRPCLNNNGIKIHNPYWILLKYWDQARKVQDKQDSKIDSPNASWYFNKTYVDGKWYTFRNIYFVIFSWLSVVCCIDDCPIVFYTVYIYYKSIILVNQIFWSYKTNIKFVNLPDKFESLIYFSQRFNHHI